MYQFIEKRHAEKVVSYADYCGLSIQQKDKLQKYVDHFVENNGYRLAIRAKDYEREINIMEIEHPTYTKKDLEAREERVKINETRDRLEKVAKAEASEKRMRQTFADRMDNGFKIDNEFVPGGVFKNIKSVDAALDITDNYF